MLCILKAVAIWLVLLLIAVNLVGFMVRGFFLPTLPMGAPSEPTYELLKRESGRFYAAHHAMTLLSIILAATFLFALYHF